MFTRLNLVWRLNVGSVQNIKIDLIGSNLESQVGSGLLLQADQPATEVLPDEDNKRG